jgi:hypothetical protein
MTSKQTDATFKVVTAIVENSATTFAASDVQTMAARLRYRAAAVRCSGAHPFRFARDIRRNDAECKRVGADWDDSANRRTAARDAWAAAQRAMTVAGSTVVAALE